MKIRAPSIIIIMAITLAALLSAACGGQSDGRIAFISYPYGNGEIYTMNPDGSSATRLVNPDFPLAAWVVMLAITRIVRHDTDHWSLAWSPDGRRIAFVSDRDGNLEIYAASADGSDLTRLTHNDTDDWSLAWSPDGRRIAFISRLGTDGDDEIYAMNADGSEITRLANSESLSVRPIRYRQLVWSPDGQRIAFVSNRDGNQDIYAANADGSGIIRLTDNDAWDDWLAWSPDGWRIAFSSNRDGNQDIYAMNADGSEITRLTNNDMEDREPAWSPDGRRIAFSSSYGHAHSSIYVMDVDGSNARMAWGGIPGYGPAWSPDGRRIVFTNYPGSGDIQTGDTEIYAINADGSGWTQLTDNDYGDYSPSWGPAR